MKIKPKEVMLNLPTVLLFQTADEIPQVASNANAFIHGKVKIKYDQLGVLNGQHVAIFYLQRNDEYHQIRDEFIRMIEVEEMSQHELEPIVCFPPDEHEHEDWEYGPSHHPVSPFDRVDPNEPHPINCMCEMCQWPM